MVIQHRRTLQALEAHSAVNMKCSDKFKIVDRLLTNWFKKLGHKVGEHPSYFIIIPFFLTLLAATGSQRIYYEDDPEYLFSPVTGRAKQERAIVKEFFPDNFTRFNPSRMTDLGKFVRLLITATDDGTLIRPEVFDEIVRLDSIVSNVTISNGERDWTFEDLCARWEGKCLRNPIVKLAPYVPDVVSGKLNLTYPIWFSDNYDIFVFPASLGSPVVSGEHLQEVPALQLLYWASNHTDFDVNVSLQWETEVLRVLEEHIHTFRHIRIARFRSQTLQTELEDNTISIMPFMFATVAIMVMFCIVTSMMGDCVRSKPLVGLLGVVSATLATGTAFGLLMYCGLPFIGINLAAPFLMLGIGIDDTFVMLAAWRRTRLQDPVPVRLSHAYEEAAVSITITSLTDMFSFWVGAVTPFPSVQIFCVYTGMSVVFTYLWHVTFFGGCMAVFGYLEEQGRHGVTCRPVLPVSQSEDRGCWYQLCCSGGISKSDPWNEKDNKDHIIMVFFRDGVAQLLNIPAIKAFVIMVFLVYLGVAIWGCTMVREGLERRRLSKDDSYSVQFYDVEDLYFREHPYRVQVIVQGKMDYSDPEVQRQVENLLQTFENSTYIEGPLLHRVVAPGLGQLRGDERAHPQHERQHARALAGGIQDGTCPITLDTAFNEKGEIVASRFIIQTRHINNTLEDKDMMLELRRICEESELECSIFHPLFVFFDQFVLVRTVSIQSISIAAGIMCVVSLIFIPNPVCSLWVAFSILSIEIGVIGYMTLWGVNLDSISMINLIMEASLPSFGVATLYFAPSYIFVTFFKTNFLVIFFGMVHGIFLLPPTEVKPNSLAALPTADGTFYVNGGGQIVTLHGKAGEMPPLRIPRPQSSRTSRTDSSVRLTTGAFTVAEESPPSLPKSRPRVKLCLCERAMMHVGASIIRITEGPSHDKYMSRRDLATPDVARH
ncbi:Patched domain-containing protein 3 [Amphibalanus amphitrite]|uniref:Patched domain-containing protein 3 n=1 Tax=Amphibalanus amphitrite TaxID=1232801 RepID=A0A6A4V982_AMPAM|nr:Patched domain-containing protein 3 [Amphibalanus amphitrite]